MTSPDAFSYPSLTSSINAAAVAVHRALGPGFLESVYEHALCIEFRRRQIRYERQRPVDVFYEGQRVGAHRLDVVVVRKVLVEVKAVDAIHEAHLAVALAYLKATGLRVGLVLNFAGPVVRIRRVFRPALWDAHPPVP